MAVILAIRKEPEGRRGLGGGRQAFYGQHHREKSQQEGQAGPQAGGFIQPAIQLP